MPTESLTRYGDRRRNDRKLRRICGARGSRATQSDQRTRAACATVSTDREPTHQNGKPDRSQRRFLQGPNRDSLREKSSVYLLAALVATHSIPTKMARSSCDDRAMKVKCGGISELPTRLLLVFVLRTALTGDWDAIDIFHLSHFLEPARQFAPKTIVRLLRLTVLRLCRRRSDECRR